MSRRAIVTIRQFLLLILLIFLTAIGSGVVAQETSGSPEFQPMPSTSSNDAQKAWEDSKPHLIGGVVSEPPPFVDLSLASLNENSIDFQSSPTAPTITIWYGTSQKAGAKGDPQKWVNVLGNVTPKPLSLTYSLNGGSPVNLRTGADNRRLAEAGDFNIELNYLDLNSGSNTVTIVAGNGQGETTKAIVTVNYQGGGVTWNTPQTYTYDWSTASRIDDLAHVVDGQWVLEGGVVRPTVLDYDRLIGIGDLSWRDYTVTVPITFSGIDEAGYDFPSNGPAVGILVRWGGHFKEGSVVSPVQGWRRLGALAWYHWDRSNVNDEIVYSEGLQMVRYGGNPGQIVTVDRKLESNITYNFKVNVESTGDANSPSIYRFKVWDASLPAEPSTWDMEYPGLSGEPPSGGLLLVAHHVNAEFGKVVVNLDSTLPLPQLTVHTAGSGSGDVDLSPSNNTNTYRFGEDVQLTANPDDGSTFVGWQGDLSGNANPTSVEMFSDRTVTATFAPENIGQPVSDDFSDCELDSRWVFIDPLGHSQLTMTGSRVQISAPAGTAHDMWTNNRNAPRIMQEIANEDFELDVKFDSAMDTMYQLQGVLAEADNTNFLRYGFHHDGSTYRIGAYTVLNNVVTTRIDQAIEISPPMYLRAERTGNTWNLSYSGDAQGWTQATQFDFNLGASLVGIYAGNAGQKPAMTSQIDYFFNTTSPIVPQDDNRKLTITTTGSGTGTVIRTPQKDNYDCDESVTLEAVQGEGSHFEGWSGDLTETLNPVTINVTNNMEISAIFSLDLHTLGISTEGEGTVQLDPPGSQFTEGTLVSLLAIPSAGYEFSSWQGDIEGNANPSVLIMNTDKSVKAIFVLAQPSETFLYLPTVIR